MDGGAKDGHMMEMSYRCCCAAAGKLLLPHSTHPHTSRVPACSAGARSTKFDMLPQTVCAVCALPSWPVPLSAADTSELRVLRARL